MTDPDDTARPRPASKASGSRLKHWLFARLLSRIAGVFAGLRRLVVRAKSLAFRRGPAPAARDPYRPTLVPDLLAIGGLATALVPDGCEGGTLSLLVGIAGLAGLAGGALVAWLSARRRAAAERELDAETERADRERAADVAAPERAAIAERHRVDSAREPEDVANEIARERDGR